MMTIGPMTIWDFIQGVVTLGAFLGILWGIFQKRRQIWKDTKWVSQRGFGLVALFTGSVVLGSVGLAIWEFPRFLSFTSAESLVGSFIGAGVGASAFAGVGTYAVLGGVWMTAPDSRPGRYVKRRFFARRDHSRGKAIDSWIGLKKRIPAAGILLVKH
jgi:hypothetical protein